MAKQKLSKSERAQLDAAVETLRRALADGEKAQREDDECAKAADAEDFGAAVKAVADKGSANPREQLQRGILAIREHPRSITDQVFGGDKKE